MKASVWVLGVLLALQMPAAWGQAKAGGSEEGFRPIFNGKDLSGWEGDARFWSVKDGAIHGETTAQNPTDHNTFLIWRDGEVDDFELRLSFKLLAHNSGVQYRSKEVDKYVIAGYQADMDYDGKFIGILYDEKGRGILANRGEKTRITPEGKPEVTGKTGDPAEILAGIKKDDWNDYTIIAQGNHLIQIINGKTTVDVTDDQPAERELAGLLALQLHAGQPMVVEFKNIRLKRLKLEGHKKIVLVAGKPSHGWGEHDFPAGIHALRKCLDAIPGIQGADYYEGWPKDPSAFDNADAIMFYMDGGSGHPVIQEDRLATLDALMKKGVGVAFVHYAVEVPADKGGKELKDWIGGYYETGYSINPHWVADFAKIPDHPITRGVKPFKILDEWYYHMRFRDDVKSVKTILAATPPDDTRKTEDAGKHPGREEIVAWAVERPDGGRGFGFTGGHFHSNWRDENFRKLILNAALWTAHAEVPAGGVESHPTEEDLTVKLRPRPAGK
jgi:type 1 glutamine amidotransferase